MRQAIRTLLIVLILASVLPLRAAAGDPVVRRSLERNLVIDYERYPRGRSLVSLPPVFLRTGENRLIYGRLLARNHTTRNIGQLVAIVCPGTSDGNVVTTRNNEGIDRRTRYGPGMLAISVRYLLTAERTGSYQCTLWGASLHRGRMVAIAAGGHTSIQMNDVSEPGAAQRFEDECPIRGTNATCNYLVPARSGQEVPMYPRSGYVLEVARFATSPGSTFDTTVHGHGVTRAAEAAVDGGFDALVEGVWRETGRVVPRYVRYIADLEVTTCYRNTGTCSDLVDRFGTAAGSLVETQAEVIQTSVPVQRAGEWGYLWWPTEGACPLRTLGPVQRTWVSNAAHHQKIHHVLQHWIDTRSACGQDILVRLRVTVLAGNPLRIEGGQLPSVFGKGLNPAWYSNAIVTLN